MPFVYILPWDTRVLVVAGLVVVVVSAACCAGVLQ